MAEADAVLASARWVWVAVSARGPHVTPMACSWANGRLWLVAARRSVKARAIRETPEIAVLVPGGVVARGRAVLLDPKDPVGLITSAPDAVRSTVATPVYAIRHAGLVADLAARATRALAKGRIPAVRAVIALDLDDAAPTAGDGDAALALDVGRGLEVVPAHWDGSRSVASFDDDVTEGSGRFALSIVKGAGDPPLDGIQLRGRATVRGREAKLEVERSSWWSGLDAGTVQVRTDP